MTSWASIPAGSGERADSAAPRPRASGAGPTLISCRLTADDIASSHLKPWPASDGDVSANVARARRVADACRQNVGPLLRHISTRDEVRDVDAIRAALGERRLSYWGVSYGTYMGAVYATLYPQRTDHAGQHVRLFVLAQPDPAAGARQRARPVQRAPGPERA